MSEKQKSTKPYQSKLIPFQKEIFKMRWAGKSLEEIKSYLEKQNVEISKPGICMFIKRRMKKPYPQYVPEHLKYILEDDKKAKTTPVEKTLKTSKIKTPEEWRKEKQEKDKDKDKKGWH